MKSKTVVERLGEIIEEHISKTGYEPESITLNKEDLKELIVGYNKKYNVDINENLDVISLGMTMYIALPGIKRGEMRTN